MVTKTEELSKKVQMLHNNARCTLLDFNKVKIEFEQKKNAKLEKQANFNEDHEFLNEWSEENDNQLNQQ